MGLDFSEFFKKYEQIVAEADAVFQTVKAQYADLVPCGKGCSDCCHALFDVTLIEALYLNHHFNAKYEGKKRSDIVERANGADRQIHKLKRKLYKDSQDGKSAEEILRTVAEARVRCPLLGNDDLCELYDNRPVTCRIYGVPTAIGGKVHTCHRTKFVQGESYPSVHLDKIHQRLTELSRELVESLSTTHARMWDILIPPSMALLTEYDEKYLGIVEEKKEAPAPAAEPKPEPEPIQPHPKSCSDCGESSGCSSFVQGGECSCGDLTITIGGPEKQD